MTTGAERLVEALIASDVRVCFANPGTSEMHFVAALDRHPEMRCVLCLFEGGATGAADGYNRMSGRVAATLLHLAPGFGNGFANLHNARKARSAVVNITGDHAAHHLRFDAPLKGDLDGVAGAVSHWVRRSGDARDVAGDGAAAVAAARSRGGQVATLILPADTAWGAAPDPAPPPAPVPARLLPDPAHIAAAAKALAGPGAVLLINGEALLGAAAESAGRIAAATGCRLIAPFFAPRIRSGAGSVAVEQVPYPVDLAGAFLAGTRTIVLLGADRPVNFFAYPGKPSVPDPAGAAILELCPPEGDVVGTLDHLARAANAEGQVPRRRAGTRPDRPAGAITPATIGAAVAHCLPEDAIVVNEAVTSSFGILPQLAHARAHDMLATTGGAIGQALPAAVGAAIACPDRRVVALSGDGSAMYTLQSLWTMARERLDVTVVIFANRGYQILRVELANMGVTDYGRNAARMFDVEDPVLDWVALATGHGVAGERVATAEDFADAMDRAFAARGPRLIEVVC